MQQSSSLGYNVHSYWKSLKMGNLPDVGPGLK